MPARRCSSCGINWKPITDKYRLCPECGERTDWMNNAEPMDESEINHRLFDVYCKQRDAKLETQMKDLECAFEAAPTIPDPGEVPADEQPEGA